MKKLIMFCMVLMLCLGIAGKAQGELVCLDISPAGAGEGDEVTMTGYDEEGAFFDLSELEVFESNFHHGEDNMYPSLLYVPADPGVNTMEVVDGSFVFTITDEMLEADVTMWDCFFIPGGDDVTFRFCNTDPEDEKSNFETVAEVLENGGTCTLGPRPIVIDPNVMLVYETGVTVGDFDVSMRNALLTGKTTTVTVDPNSNGDGPSDDITLIGGSVVDGSITLTFIDETATDTNSIDLAIASCVAWNPATRTSCWNCPQPVVFKAIDDDIAEPQETGDTLIEPQSILVTSVYSETLQDPNWAGEKVVKVNVYDNDQANILFTVTPAYTTGTPGAPVPVTGPIQILEQPYYFYGWKTRFRDIGVKLQVQPSGGDVRIVVFNEGVSGNQPIIDPNLTEASDPNALIFTTENWDMSQTITISANDDDVLQIEEAGVEGDQNYQAEIAFIVADGGGDVRYQWLEEIEDDEGPTGEFEKVGILRVVDIDIEDNECGAYGISYLDVSNPYYLMNEDDLETAIGYHQDPNDWPVDRPDCYVNIHDVIEFATKWLNCSDPQTEGCESYL